jgi:outer membrane receptor for ferrienterochelin and colicin
MRIFLLSFFFLISFFGYSQNATIKGKVVDVATNEPIPSASVTLIEIGKTVLTDINGNYIFQNINAGLYTVSASFIGYKKIIVYEIQVTNVKAAAVDIAMEEEITTLDSITITASPFNKKEESPNSMRTINSSEIFRNPGGNRDISKVIQSLPGVASSASFRNDIIIRGGAPNENRFFIDGIEVPNINHFATQGSSGGPVGMINVNFIREVDFYTGAFPANRGNTLSSVMEMKLTEGNTEKLVTTFTLGSSDVGLTLDGPMGKKSSFVFSARRSYLQFLFSALKLPFLPTYNDFQYKQSFIINDKNRITILGLGAIDDFELNQSANDGVTDSTVLERNKYILSNIPVNNQWNYTAGAKWQHYQGNNNFLMVISRNHLNNSALKYIDNIEVDSLKIFDYQSQEIENKLRIENTWRKNNWKINYGVSYEFATYTNSTFKKVSILDTVITVNFNSELSFGKYAAFGQASKTLLNDKAIVSFGLRTDFADYSAEMQNPLEQLSPRFSLSYSFSKKWGLNLNTGYYYQLPAYTVIGYRNQNNELENRNNKIKYIGCAHFVGGVEYNANEYLKITVESFYKTYSNYPFTLRDSISLANLGGDFGVIGNEPVSPISEGRSYGVEFFAQQKLAKNFYGLLSYTYVKSEFTDKNGNLVPSAWDNRHILNLTLGRRFKKNWEAGVKFRLLGGAPYTPINVQLSSIKQVWDANQQGIADWTKLNTERLPLSHGLDIRVDKKWNFKKWALNIYIDVQNIYNFQAQAAPFLNVYRDANGNPITNPNNPSSYKTYFIQNTNGTVLPSIGMQMEF